MDFEKANWARRSVPHKTENLAKNFGAKLNNVIVGIRAQLRVLLVDFYKFPTLNCLSKGVTLIPTIGSNMEVLRRG